MDFVGIEDCSTVNQVHCLSGSLYAKGSGTTPICRLCSCRATAWRCRSLGVPRTLKAHGCKCWDWVAAKQEFEGQERRCATGLVINELL